MLELLDMQKAGKIKDETPIENEDGIGGGGDNLIGFADEMLGGVFLTPRQQAFLRVLGYTGSMYMSQDECSRRIESLKIKGSRADDVDFDEEVDKAVKNHEQYIRDALVAFGKGERFKAQSSVGGTSILLTLFLLPLRAVLAILKALVSVLSKFVIFAFKALGLAGKGAVLAGKGAVVAGQKGAELAKDAATKAAEFEKENKVLQGTAARLLDGAKKGASMLADSLCIEQEQPFRTWTSADGKHTIEARLVGVSNGVVRLQKPDGSMIDIQQAQLCPADAAVIATK